MTDRVRLCVALALACVATISFWFAMDRPVPAPDWTGRSQGMSYNPSGLYTDAQAQNVPRARIARDVAQLAETTDRIRTYSVSRGLDIVPELAKEAGIRVSLGIWLSADRAFNDDEIARALVVIRKHPTVIDRIFVGNEAVLRGDLPADEVAAYIGRVKAALPQAIPISTAEPWQVWRAHPQLAAHADFIGAHFIPFWEGLALDKALPAIGDGVGELRELFAGKPVIIAEVGWPSEGRTFRSAVASPANQAAFVRSFLAAAKDQSWDYYLIEAYDQPWKVAIEGAVGAYWGMFDAAGAPKFQGTGPITALPDWHLWAAAAVMALLILGIFVLRQVAVDLRGQIFLGLAVAAMLSGGLAIYQGAALTYASIQTWAVYGIVFPLGLLAAAVLLSEAVEFAHTLWRNRARNAIAAPMARAPFVSIHVPAYNEPPQMMIETLNALARLDYPRFEVVVLDNNTRDPAMWRPVQDHCRRLGARFRFFHFDNVQGFKAGALNLALNLTDAAAEIVAVIDSDYQVAPDWLARAVPHFADPKVGVVQAPQDYRDADESAFKAMAYQEYAGFFRIGMVERDHDNAIVQHGTMTMIRREALDRARWSEWCITEDTELGLRLFEQGWKAVYLDQSFGRGVMPDTYSDFKIQRYRWVYGAMQIAKEHWRDLTSPAGRLSAAQKYHFLSGWLPWISDALSLVFVFAALVWTALMVIDPVHFDAPLAALGFVAIAMFAAKVAKTLILYPIRVKSGVKGALMASLAGLSLSHTVARAVIAGLTTKHLPFIRTPKWGERAGLAQIVAMAREEAVLFAALMAAIVATFLVRGEGDPAGWVWMAALAVQAVPYAASIAVSAISVWPQAKPVTAPKPATAMDEPVRAAA